MEERSAEGSVSKYFLWTVVASLFVDHVTHSNRTFIRWKMQRNLLLGFKDLLSHKEPKLMQDVQLPYFVMHSDWYKSYVLPKELHLSLPLDPSRPLVLHGPGSFNFNAGCGKTSRIFKYAEQMNKVKGTPVAYIPLKPDVVPSHKLSYAGLKASTTLLRCIGYPLRPSVVDWLFLKLNNNGTAFKLFKTPKSFSAWQFSHGVYRNLDSETHHQSLTQYVEHALKEYFSICYKVQQKLMKQHGLSLTEATPLIIIDEERRPIPYPMPEAFRPNEGRVNLFPSVASLICKSAMEQKCANIVMTASVSSALNDLEDRLSSAELDGFGGLRKLDFSEWARPDIESQLQKVGYSLTEINRIFEVFGCGASLLLNNSRESRKSAAEIETAIEKCEEQYMKYFDNVFRSLYKSGQQHVQQFADILDSLASGKTTFVMWDQIPSCIHRSDGYYYYGGIQSLLLEQSDSSLQVRSHCVKYVWLKNKHVILKKSARDRSEQ